MDVSELKVGEDPRITGEYVRPVSGAEQPLVLVGVVHDHPASAYRVREVIQSVDPAVIALELPPIAIPLFEQYAADERTPPPFGGEMSAAIQATSAAKPVGIDRPTWKFGRRLLGNLVRERPSAGTVRTLASNMVSTAKHAVFCRAAATVAAVTSLRLEVDAPISHDTDWSDSPAVQARDEQRRIRQTQSFMNAVGTGEYSRASSFEDKTREQHMAEQLSDLNDEGPVVAVVGIDHLAPVAELLESRDSAPQ